MKLSNAAVLRIACLVLMLACGSLAHAASLQVAPTSVVFQPGSKGQALWLSNTGTDAPVRTQVRLYKWTQKDGEETLEPTNDLVVSPPLAELEPGARQMIRVIRTSPAPTEIETSYRVIVDEVPPPDTERHTGLRLLMRYSVPVFVLPETKEAPTYDLRTSLETQNGATSVVIQNNGRLHAQIADVTHLSSDGTRQLLLKGLVGYVLPGQTMRWSLPASAQRQIVGGSLQARVNAEAVEHVLIDDLARR